MERPRWGPPASFPPPPPQQQFALQSNQRFALLDKLIAQQKRGIPQPLQRFVQQPVPSPHSSSPMGASHHPRPLLNGAPSHRPHRPNHLNQLLRHPSFNPPSPTHQRPVLRPRCLPAWFQQKPLGVSQPPSPKESCSQTKPAQKLQQAPSENPNQSALPSTAAAVQNSGATETPLPAPGSQGPVPPRSLQDRLQLLTEPSPLQPPAGSCPFNIPLPSCPAPKKSIPLDEPSKSSTSSGEGSDHVKQVPLPKLLQAEKEVTKVLITTISGSLVICLPDSPKCNIMLPRQRIQNSSIHCAC